MQPTEINHIINEGFKLLPEKLTGNRARCMVYAIGMQESQFLTTAQGANGPARGYWQFEIGGGCWDVLNRPRLKEHTLDMCQKVNVEPTATAIMTALENPNYGAFGAALARILLLQLPQALPDVLRQEEEEAWRQYLAAWRPANYHRERSRLRWANSWAEAVKSRQQFQPVLEGWYGVGYNKGNDIISELNSDSLTDVGKKLFCKGVIDSLNAAVND